MPSRKALAWAAAVRGSGTRADGSGTIVPGSVDDRALQPAASMPAPTTHADIVRRLMSPAFLHNLGRRGDAVNPRTPSRLRHS